MDSQFGHAATCMTLLYLNIESSGFAVKTYARALYCTNQDRPSKVMVPGLTLLTHPGISPSELDQSEVSLFVIGTFFSKAFASLASVKGPGT